MTKLKPILEIALSSWKAFLAAFLAVFIMTVLQNLGLAKPLQSLTVPQIKTNTFDKIQPKLEQKTNEFKLIKSELLIPSFGAEDNQNLEAYLVANTDSGEILLEKDSSKKLPVASLTKIMTAVIALDLTEISDQFTVSNNAANIQPTKMGLVPQQKWSRDELLNALILTSANDAAEALKEGIDQKYGQGTFIKAMNEKAKFLELKNTKFDNPQGLDGNSNFSTAEDLAILTSYALKNYPVFKEIAARDYQFYPATENHKQADLYNWNGLLGVYPGVSGVKIGNTGKAGYTTIVVSEREGKQLLAVALGAPGVLQRDLWTAQLLDLGFQKAAGLEPVNITQDQLQAKYNSWQYFD